jgi:hypothetical protein
VSALPPAPFSSLLVHLWQVVLVSRRVIEVAVPEIEQEVDRVRTVTHLPEPILGKFQAATLCADYIENFLRVEGIRLGQLVGQRFEQSIGLPAECTGEQAPKQI